MQKINAGMPWFWTGRYFFPEGGGQLSDRGTLGGVKMTYAAQRGSEVVHYCERPLPVGVQVEAVLDWQARLDHMQQHAGEHILFACGLEAVRS